MRGFPKHISTAQDYKNLLTMPEFKDQAAKELKRLGAIKDSKITKATTLIDPKDPEGGWNTTEVVNPNPKWNQLNFKSKKELTDLIGVEVKKHDK